MSPRSNEQVLIAGAGPIGLAAAISAKRRGIDPLLIDAGALANSIAHYPVGMVFFTTPERLEIGGHPLVCAGPKATREEALKYYRGVARTECLRVQTYTRLVGVERRDDGIHCELQTRLGSTALVCDRLVLATGYFDQPNRLDVPGEELPHVSHYFDDPHLSYGQDVVVVGGKNSAVEAALQLFRAGAHVTLVHRGAAFPLTVKYWLRPDIENRIKAGEIRVRMPAQVVEISPRDVSVQRGDGGLERIAADRVYALIGFHPDFELFRRAGIEFAVETGRPTLNAATLETSVPGIYLAGSLTAGRKISEVFIENGRFDGEKIFGDPTSRSEAERRYAGIQRPVGE
jgi:thioredoxin reductase (NADPH)